MAMRSCKEFAGTEGPTVTMTGALPNIATQSKSLTGSYGSFFTTAGFIVNAVDAINSV
jgi:hypothetical protein